MPEAEATIRVASAPAKLHVKFAGEAARTDYNGNDTFRNQ